MCGKFAAGHLTQRQMADLMNYFLYGTLLPDGSVPSANPGYQVNPTDLVNMAMSQEDGFLLTSAKWQMTPQGSSRKLINSKIENAEFWARYWQSGRCVIPAIGYYEWSEVDGRKEPHFITIRRNNPLLFFAGFYGRGSDGKYECSIITRKPAEQIAHLHSRMPVIMAPEQIQNWLTYTMSQEQAQNEMGTGWEGRFEYHRVAPIKSDSEGPELIEPYDPPQASFDF
ncbi:SOS response-associated peptidase family protein [Aliiroseovarius sp. Z3]|uniref:SOS response-associated peptidase n=1 Tax=Aliiroseovarius sp. Z3 TaxID=2811402 RepID=UPI0023B35578|nr:SOS response-associated peptidase family protein [Aliiroseovarius sp. Z3]MDE9449998.1 SOS response-associated peptidase family protein [Aliiroseovarius sp. Z3]